MDSSQAAQEEVVVEPPVERKEEVPEEVPEEKAPEPAFVKTIVLADCFNILDGEIWYTCWFVYLLFFSTNVIFPTVLVENGPRNFGLGPKDMKNLMRTCRGYYLLLSRHNFWFNSLGRLPMAMKINHF